MQSRHALVASGVLFSALLLPMVAEARLESCGGIFLTGEASCQFVRDQECETSCEVTSVETACVATLQTECEAECTATAETECTETCSPVCVEECTAVEMQSSRGLCR